MRSAVVISCEHGGHRLPPAWRHLAIGHDALLTSHRGWDPGALTLARTLAAATGAPLVHATASRLLVELNRSPGHAALFSELTRRLAPPERERLLERHYRPYRATLEAQVRRAARRAGRVVHVSAHSFTPVLDGAVRAFDVGLLYDPARHAERSFCAAWRLRLAAAAPDLVVRRNAPYRGVADGLTTWLRRQLPHHRYLGIELEVNQRHPLGPRGAWRRLRGVLAATLAATVADREVREAQDAHRRKRRRPPPPAAADGRRP